MKFSTRLKELITESNKTQKEIAKILKLSQNQIYYYIKGTAQPSIETLIEIANYFNVTIDYLVGRTNY